MPFDLWQMLIATCAVTALQGVIMLTLWARHPQATWLPWRALIFLLGGSFLFLFAIDHPGLRQISIGLGTATFIGATFAVWSSARVFNGKPVVWPALIVTIGLWAGLGIVMDTLDSLLPAAIVQSVAGFSWIGAGALEHWNARRRGVRGQLGVTVLYGAVALFFALRLPFVVSLPFPLGGLPMDETLLAVFILGLDVAALLLTVATWLSLRAQGLEGKRPEVLR
ncbi:MAG: hypothetical protein EOP22_08350 [Hyphomicrobiales bacterium]|nr:MAG: hypothetical protein EOP22_08350 [Hyphomicrobiales bacterium]